MAIATIGPAHDAAAQQHVPIFPGSRTSQLSQLTAFRSRIQHIVFLIKENRSFDMYFGTFPGADGTTTATISTGERVTLRHALDRMPRDVGHDWEDARIAMHGGAMDRFDMIRGNQRNDMLSLTQFTRADIPNYWSYAEHFALADRMFSSLAGPSFPNHLYTVAGQSVGAVNNPNSFSWGCDAEANTRVDVMAADGGFTRQYP